ncbi:nucleolar protein 12-domain-containing protein [Cokeromyces recurvatus]|uniref:nucleolar protein 12-domain-containing protein n=1 Tax=Cokeromyces recurvatus TaxID=90255 RepID=UPI00221F0F8C|nr:nucleolar protein 12-domain-containing protein [Cokeromyces recurvatus]KAI7902422.1 nucleolar protein 12-domain-containing protein [Cokeromyces recurvatus]
MKVKNQKKKLKNTDILSAGSKIYAKKRKAKEDIVESVDFDEASRTEFLTGFHKRKLERKKKTKEKYAKLAREEKLRNRREMREQRQRLADKNIQEMAAMLRTNIEESDTFDSEEGEEEEQPKKEPKVKEFKGKSTLTTVTVIEDLNLDDQ